MFIEEGQMSATMRGESSVWQEQDENIRYGFAKEDWPN